MDLGVIDGFWFQIGRLLADFAVFIGVIFVFGLIVAVPLVADELKRRRARGEAERKAKIAPKYVSPKL